MKCRHHNCKQKATIIIEDIPYCEFCALWALSHKLKRKKHINCIQNKDGCYCKCNIKKRETAQ